MKRSQVNQMVKKQQTPSHALGAQVKMTPMQVNALRVICERRFLT